MGYICVSLLIFCLIFSAALLPDVVIKFSVGLFCLGIAGALIFRNR